MVLTSKVTVALTFGRRVLATSARAGASRGFHSGSQSPTSVAGGQTFETFGTGLVSKEDFVNTFGTEPLKSNSSLIRVNLGAHRYLFKVSPENRSDHLELLWKGSVN
jgi:hypothetical protein